MSKQDKGFYRCWEVLELRHKPQAQQLSRWTIREAWCSWMGMSYKGTRLPQWQKGE